MIKLSLPDIGDEELAEIKKVFDSKYLVQGDYVENFERQIKNFLDCKYVFAVSSGTAALHLACLALNIEPGQKVIVPDFTFPATANVVEVCGAQAVFSDISSRSFCLNTEEEYLYKLENLIDDKTKAIIPVHEFGYPVDMEKILNLSLKHNLYIIEDAACALGSKYKDQIAGTLGNIGCFSLHPRKAITTGEGGIVVTNDDKLAEKIRALRNHGILYENLKPSFKYAGLNYRMTNIQGAIGTIQFKKFDKLMQTRKQIVEWYFNLLKDEPNITLPAEPEYGIHTWQTFHILINDKYNRNDMINYMKENGVECNYGANALHIEPYFTDKYNYIPDDFPNSTKAYQHGLALPLHFKVKYEDVEYIVSKIKSFFYR